MEPPRLRRRRKVTFGTCLELSVYEIMSCLAGRMAARSIAGYNGMPVEKSRKRGII